MLRPHISQVLDHTYEALKILRENLMCNLNEKSIAVHFKHNPSIRKLVMLVLVSINHLLPVPDQEQE